MGIHINIRQVSLVLAVLCSVACAQEGHSHDRRSQERRSQDGHSQGGGGGGRCGQGRFWSAEARLCVDCTVCADVGRGVTLRPCGDTRDAQCGRVADLRLDWSWLRGASEEHRVEARGKKKVVAGAHSGAHSGAHERINSLSEAEALLRDELRHMPSPHLGQNDKMVDFGDDYILPDHPRQPHQHQHPHPLHNEKKQHKKKRLLQRLTSSRPFDEYDDFGASGDEHGVDVSDDEDIALAAWRRAQRNRAATTAALTSTTTPPPTPSTTRTPVTTVNLVEDFIVEKEAEDVEPRAVVDVVATSQTFSTAETLVWDWQAGVLVAAVCACLLFFIVAAVYSCQHALHFKKLKKHLDADMEEISARLALMTGMGSENLQDSGAPNCGMAALEKDAFPARRDDHHLRAGRHQNDYCLATLPRKTRV